MYFSQKLKVIEEYHKWIEEIKEKKGISVKDCYETFLAFLETKGYRKAEEVQKETEKRIYQMLYDLCTKNNPFGAYDLLKEDVLGWAKEDGVEIEECKTIDFENIEQSDVIELPCKQEIKFSEERSEWQVVWRDDYISRICFADFSVEADADAFLEELKGGKR